MPATAERNSGCRLQREELIHPCTHCDRWATIGKSLQCEHIQDLNVRRCSLTDEKADQIGLRRMYVKKINSSENREIIAVG